MDAGWAGESIHTTGVRGRLTPNVERCWVWPIPCVPLAQVAQGDDRAGLLPALADGAVVGEAHHLGVFWAAFPAVFYVMHFVGIWRNDADALLLVRTWAKVSVGPVRDRGCLPTPCSASRWRVVAGVGRLCQAPRELPSPCKPLVGLGEQVGATLLPYLERGERDHHDGYRHPIPPRGPLQAEVQPTSRADTDGESDQRGSRSHCG